MKKRSFKLLVVLMIAMIAIIGPLSAASAATFKPINNIKHADPADFVLTEKDIQASRIIAEHLDTYIDADGNKQVKVTNKKLLQVRLKSIDYPLNVNELVTAVERFNHLIVSENGDGVITDLVNAVGEEFRTTGEVTTNALTCSDVLGALSLIHSGLYSAAAYALGITGPAGVTIPILIATAYYLGSLLCP